MLLNLASPLLNECLRRVGKQLESNWLPMLLPVTVCKYVLIILI